MIAPLTDDERKLVTLAANGATRGAIGRTFGVTDTCVSRYIRQLCDRYGAKNGTHLVALLLLAGLLTEQDIEPGRSAT